MRITDMTALSGFARSTAELASDVATLVHNLVLDIRDSYRPGVHCMRGPGPKWRAKSIRRVVVAAPLTVQAEKRQDKTRAASREMTSSNQFNAFAAARGEGLHPSCATCSSARPLLAFRRSQFGMTACSRPDQIRLRKWRHRAATQRRFRMKNVLPLSRTNWKYRNLESRLHEAPLRPWEPPEHQCQHNRRYDDEETFALHDSRSFSSCLDLRRAGALDLRRSLEPSLRDAERRVRSDL